MIIPLNDKNNNNAPINAKVILIYNIPNNVAKNVTINATIINHFNITINYEFHN